MSEAIEKLSAEIHAVYQHELDRQGVPSKHARDYADLPEQVKELDRALARFFMAEIAALKEKLSMTEAAYNHSLDQAIAALKELMECGHPKACLGPVPRDNAAGIVWSACIICAEIAALKELQNCGHPKACLVEQKHRVMVIGEDDSVSSEPTFRCSWCDSIAAAKRQGAAEMRERIAQHVPWSYGKCSCGAMFSQSNSATPYEDWQNHVRSVPLDALEVKPQYDPKICSNCGEPFPHFRCFNEKEP